MDYEMLASLFCVACVALYRVLYASRCSRRAALPSRVRGAARRR